MLDEVMELLGQCGPTRTNRGLQLELDTISSFSYQSRYLTGTAKRVEIGARLVVLSQNPSLRTDPWNLILGSILPKLIFLVGASTTVWGDEKKPDGDSVLKCMNLWYIQAIPLVQSACDNAVGARKVMC
jgi:hypothetical protein